MGRSKEEILNCLEKIMNHDKDEIVDNNKTLNLLLLIQCELLLDIREELKK